MKYVKYPLIVILALILIFFLIGIVKKSVSYGCEVQVNKTVEEAWAVAKDESKFDQWLEGFKSIELIEGEQDAIGSKYKVVVNPGEGQEDFEMIQTLLDFKENEFVEFHYGSDMMDFEYVITYGEKDGKTSIKTDSKVLGKGIVMRSMFALMEGLGGSFTKQETKNLEALKVLIDENTTDYFPALPPPVPVDSVAADTLNDMVEE